VSVDLGSLGSLAACAVGAGVVLLVSLVASALPGARAPSRRALLRAGVVAALAVPAVEWGARAAGWGLLGSAPGVVAAGASPRGALEARAALPRTPAASDAPSTGAAAPSTLAAGPEPVAAPSTATARADLSPWLLGIWLAGVVVLSARLLARVRAASRLRRGLAPARDPRVLAAARLAAARVGLPAVDVLEGRDVPSPMTIGFRRPVVALPVGFAATLGDDDLRAVLAHEAAHVAGRDPLAALLARGLRALHWFDPLAHLAVRRLHDADEAVADLSAVSGDPAAPRRYLACLVRLAEAGLERPRAAVTCLGARGGALERRAAALLAPGATDGAGLSRRARVTALATAVLAAGVVASARPGPAVAGEPPPGLVPVPAVGLSYRGRVVGPDGAPVSGAAVYVIHGPAPQVLIHHALLPWLPLAESPPIEPVGGSDLDRAARPTGDDGRFDVGGVEPPAGGFVVVVHPEFVPTRATARAETLAAGVLDVGDVRLERGGSLRAKVLAPDGAPAAGAWVVVQPASMPWDRFSPGEIRSAKTDAAGEATVSGLRPVPYVAAAFTGDLPPVERPFQVGAGATHDATFALRAGAALRVVVANRATGALLEGARVDLERKPPEDQRIFQVGVPPLATRRTGADGAVEFPALEPGEYVATATPPDYADDAIGHPPPFSVGTTATAGSEVRILLDPPLRIPVALASKGATSGEGLARAIVEAHAEWEKYDRTGGLPYEIRKSTLESAESPLVLEGIRAGPWRFSVWAPDHLPQRSDVVDVGEGTAPRFVLEPAKASAQGRVVTRAGAPVAGAELSTYEWIDYLGDGQRTKATTDASGAFRLSPLLGSGYALRVEVRAPGFLFAVVQRPADDRAGALGDLVLVRAATVRGSLSDASGRPLAGVEVMLAPEGSNVRGKDAGLLAATTDATGSFSLRDVRPGRHTLHVPGRPPFSFAVPEGATVDLGGASLPPPR
jgi:beta-lactamase regulating signal transducer with metallopeptidase domain